MKNCFMKNIFFGNTQVCGKQILISKLLYAYKVPTLLTKY